MRKIFFDIETTGFLNDPSAYLTLLVIYDSETGEYSSYLEEDLPKLWPILEKADVLIGYNSDNFDIPFLNRYYEGDLSEISSLDILDEIKNSYGREVVCSALITSKDVILTGLSIRRIFFMLLLSLIL